MNTLRKKYKEKIAADLKNKLTIGNVMAVPRLEKIVINCGLGEAIKDKKVIESASAQLAVITGQKPKIARAKKAISSFKLQAGDIIGLKVTLRNERMYDFLEKFVGIALPRVRDFRGISKKSFDGCGNYTLGIREQTIFPELDYKMVDRLRGFEITFVTSASDNREAFELLSALGLPFERKKER